MELFFLSIPTNCLGVEVSESCRCIAFEAVARHQVVLLSMAVLKANQHVREWSISHAYNKNI